MARFSDDPDFLDALAEAEADVELGYALRHDQAVTNRYNRERAERKARRARNEAKGIRYITCSDGKSRPACKGTNLYGEPCGAIPIKKGKILRVPNYEEECTATGGYCLRCDDAVTDAFMAAWSARANGGRKRRVGPDQYIREMVQQAVGLFIRPHLNAMGVEINKDTGKPSLVPGGGAKIYGESKDGDIIFTNVDDVEAQQKAAERLFDRGFGRPRTQAEIAMVPTGGVHNIPPTSERALEVAEVLKEAGAVEDDAAGDE